MDLGLQDKHAIVTGGSRGIGKAIARELAREGADVAIVARNEADLEATAREVAAETNRRIVPLAADVTSKEQVDPLSVVQRFPYDQPVSRKFLDDLAESPTGFDIKPRAP